ncbi:uncharacterized protein TRUGW13939_06986 [Talaromyces rugulosus]|uniref:Uncharacterized protein n=1 Tax=Talaromyces rugulosus TaxID=121627 RepID=A0A7H8R0C4_TALRU|nr:uncharacterized protein TRUGW13939_06986 [Talaromyces rugulosus]QKX59844.1 hypothetical protein TRUGW13939_06986 [Talaromyces rugulosus]
MKLLASTSALSALMFITITAALSMTEPLDNEPDITVSILSITKTQTETTTATSTDTDTVTALSLPLLPKTVSPSGSVIVPVVGVESPTTLARCDDDELQKT